jgi:hypothetical protein
MFIFKLFEFRLNDVDAFKNFDHAKYIICELNDSKFYVYFKKCLSSDPIMAMLLKTLMMPNI